MEQQLQIGLLFLYHLQFLEVTTFTPITICRFSGLVGSLGVGLSNMGGYNGLPSIMSGLDDSMSDVGAKKKYPFELEKAIHNVMFIQHHMQRQDEFNAVSGIVILSSLR